MAPALPMTNAGRTIFQYLSGESANARRIVAITRRPCAKRSTYLGLILRESGPLKLAAKASAPMGILNAGYIPLVRNGIYKKAAGTYMRSATEMTDQ